MCEDASLVFKLPIRVAATVLATVLAAKNRAKMDWEGLEVYTELLGASTLPETNSKFTPENQWLGSDEKSFWGV